MRKLAIVLLVAVVVGYAVVTYLSAATAPWDFSMSEATFNEIVVEWSSSVSSGVIDSLKVVNVSDSSLVSVIDSTGIANKTALVTGLTPNTTYRWRIAIVDTAGTTTYSNADTLATNDPAHYNFALSYPTSTTMRVTFTSAANPSFFDSLCVVNVSDSSVVALIDSTTTANADSLTTVVYTVTGLTPGTTYRWRVMVSDTTSTDYFSNADTLSTKYPIYTIPASGSYPYTQRVYSYTSWPASNTNNAITISGTDSLWTAVYFPLKYTSLVVQATQANDSTKATIYAYSGVMSESGTMIEALMDSINITTAGVKHESISLPVSPHVRYKVKGITGNGKNASYVIYQAVDR